jgi:hypothetical protein
MEDKRSALSEVESHTEAEVEREMPFAGRDPARAIEFPHDEFSSETVWGMQERPGRRLATDSNLGTRHDLN